MDGRARGDFTVNDVLNLPADGHVHRVFVSQCTDDPGGMQVFDVSSDRIFGVRVKITKNNMETPATDYIFTLTPNIQVFILFQASVPGQVIRGRPRAG